jgi:hypothetical protein
VRRKGTGACLRRNQVLESGGFAILLMAKKKFEKVGRESDAIALHQQRKSEFRAGAKLSVNIWRKGIELSEVMALEWYDCHRPKQLYDATIHLEAFREDLGSRVAISAVPHIRRESCRTSS